jgi:hypothetical protein
MGTRGSNRRKYASGEECTSSRAIVNLRNPEISKVCICGGVPNDWSLISKDLLLRRHGYHAGRLKRPFIRNSEICNMCICRETQLLVLIRTNPHVQRCVYAVVAQNILGHINSAVQKVQIYARDSKDWLLLISGILIVRGHTYICRETKAVIRTNDLPHFLTIYPHFGLHNDCMYRRIGA